VHHCPKISALASCAAQTKAADLQSGVDCETTCRM
jgi:hypothetical protein